MADLQQAPEIDIDKLMAFVFKAVDEVGATLNTALVVMGDKLGYYTAMATGPVTPLQLAEATDTALPYAREWLNAQAAGGYVEFDAESGKYLLPPEHAAALTDPGSPAYLPGFFQIALGTTHDVDGVLAAALNGSGLGWHEHHSDVHEGCERFFRTMYNTHLLGQWLPALDGVVEKLESGARVADVGCGHGASTLIMAKAFPRSTFIGFDYHDLSIQTARKRAREAGVEANLGFETASATGFPGTGFDLVTTFDALHDMGDPVGAASHVRQAIAEDGTWMVVEPMSGDTVAENLNPVGRAYYGFSTLLCTPCSLAQEVGLALGTQAGPARIHDVVSTGGFTRFASVSQTPFNRVLEVRP
ncbi:class I SAM-dependent methyltransferase [Paeniglutamicibacter psychrophenolicus]|uniref:SAM-dependent methyltransferase n=1 Tax=Paeniglutamicibacter psychrophenolicus TaxID=257454 RepID=A0ABS4WER7_9MICC|nr:class I SAM-dependent methyltransferase [Paeniglutamicibacter psychrophenolicus]MBP2374665.1 SAM-dependent methyltransferase [Paeniglutamicibacter psychrophenolicus]